MRPFVLSVTAVFAISLSLSQETTSPIVGQKAPDFALPYATKDSIFRTPLRLTETIGKQNIILAFYPADWSGGCTKEVCTMRDDFGSLQKLNADVLAISGDYVWSHYEWAKHHNLPFRLLSDHSHEVAKTYASYNDKNQYNKRTVFVIDKQGNIAYVDPEYSVRDNEDFNRLKEALSKLQ
ncbi:MAG: peroxiredoxin [Ignavibacteriales bacterium]|nr:peroxiredoxin [Ignavibacteriales bacterium]